jgi:hypothetical protein
MRLKNLLKEIVKDECTHAKWLNSLSYLEYSGFRKIIKSKKTPELDVTIISHIFEEVRHAFYLKKMAIMTGGQQFSSYSDDVLFAPEAIKNYFYNLDHGATSILDEKYKSYFLITSLVEDRALEIYRIYNQILNEKGSSLSLDFILGDEEEHLSYVTKNLKVNNYEKYLSHENKCFQTMLNEMERILVQ